MKHGIMRGIVISTQAVWAFPEGFEIGEFGDLGKIGEMGEISGELREIGKLRELDGLNMDVAMSARQFNEFNKLNELKVNGKWETATEFKPADAQMRMENMNLDAQHSRIQSEYIRLEQDNRSVNSFKTAYENENYYHFGLEPNDAHEFEFAHDKEFDGLNIPEERVNAKPIETFEEYQERLDKKNEEMFKKDQVEEKLEQVEKKFAEQHKQEKFHEGFLKHMDDLEEQRIAKLNEDAPLRPAEEVLGLELENGKYNYDKGFINEKFVERREELYQNANEGNVEKLQELENARDYLLKVNVESLENVKEVQAKYSKLGVDPESMNPEEFEKFKEHFEEQSQQVQDLVTEARDGNRESKAALAKEVELQKSLDTLDPSGDLREKHVELQKKREEMAAKAETIKKKETGKAEKKKLTLELKTEQKAYLKEEKTFKYEVNKANLKSKVARGDLKEFEDNPYFKENNVLEMKEAQKAAYDTLDKRYKLRRSWGSYAKKLGLLMVFTTYELCKGGTLHHCPQFSGETPADLRQPERDRQPPAGFLDALHTLWTCTIGECKDYMHPEGNKGVSPY